MSIAIALAGCASGTPSTAYPSPSASSTTPLESDSTSPAEMVSADPADWTITFDGVGPLTLQGSLAEQVPLTGPGYAAASPDSCPNPAMTILTSKSNPTIWLEASADAPDSIRLIAVGGDVPGDQREIGSSKTQEGISVGTSLAKLLGAYPTGQLEKDSQSKPDRLVVAGTRTSGARGYLIFDLFDGATVQTILVQTNSDPVHEFCG